MQSSSYTDKDLRNEVFEFITNAIHNGEIIDPIAIVHRVLSGWGTVPETVPGSEAFMFSGYRAVRGAVNAVTRDFREDRDDGDVQLLLPGHKKLQLAYLCRCEEGQRLIPTPLMTRDDWDRKKDEMRRMQKGLQEHIDEIDRYVLAHF